MGISAIPGIVTSTVRKQSYVREAMKFDIKKLDSYLKVFVPEARQYVASSLTPGGGYEGVWCRDSSYVLTEVLEEGKTSKAIEWMLWIWSHQISESTRGTYGRGAPQSNFKTKKISQSKVRDFKGALPTSIHRGYCEIYGVCPDIDSNALQISSACRILIQSGNKDLFNKMYPKIQSAITFLESRDVDGDYLLEQGGNEDWMDTMLRSGKTVYSQALWIEALRNWSTLLSEYGKQTESDQVSSKVKQSRKAVESIMWDGRSYVDRLDDDNYKGSLPQDTVYYVFISEDNEERCKTTLEEIKSRLWRPLGPACIDPCVASTAPSRHAPLLYQNGGFWPWITAREITCRAMFGQKDLVKILVEKTIPFMSLEWVEPKLAKRSGRYPFRTSIAAMLSTLRKIKYIT